MADAKDDTTGQPQPEASGDATGQLRPDSGWGRLGVGDAAAWGTALGVIVGVSYGLIALLQGGKYGSSLQSFVSYVGAWSAVASAGAVIAAQVANIFGTKPLTLGDIFAIPPRWIAVLFLGLSLVGGASLAYFMPLRLPLAVVRTSTATCLAGRYIGRDSNGVHLIDGRSKDLLTIAQTDVSAIQIGPTVRADRVGINNTTCSRLLSSAVP
jgi:hypothetical protein